MPKKGHSYHYKYEGNFTSIDALTVLQSQINFVSILKEIKDHQFPEIKLEIKIKGLEKGSLDVHHLLEVAAVSGMFVMDNYKYITTVFKIFGDLIKLKRFLKGEKADDVKKVEHEKIEVHLHGDNIQVHPGAITIYQNSPVISNAFNNTGRVLDGNEDLQYIVITETNSRKKLTIQKDEFKILGAPNPYLIGRTDEQTYKQQILFIKKPNLFPDKKKKWVWDFLHQGRDIKGVIVDEAFMKQIDDGLRIGQGDRIKADLKIFYRYDEKLATFIESGKYEVLNVTEVIRRTDQSKFDY